MKRSTTDKIYTACWTLLILATVALVIVIWKATLTPVAAPVQPPAAVVIATSTPRVAERAAASIVAAAVKGEAPPSAPTSLAFVTPAATCVPSDVGQKADSPTAVESAETVASLPSCPVPCARQGFAPCAGSERGAERQAP
jgi:hypothetical protein